MTEGYDLLDALEHIDPASLSYEDWCHVGMALHHEGFPADVWREWSLRDPGRFDERDFRGKWAGFGHMAGSPVTGGTIVKLARDAGWSPRRERAHRALAWDAVIGGHEDEPAIVDAEMIDDVEVGPVYPKGHGRDELRAFINALFEDGEFVGYVTDCSEKVDDAGRVKLVPGSRGVYARTAREIKDALAGGLENALGTLHGESGAWMRFNPLDGQGVGNANVTAYRFALLESDDMPVGKFAEIVRQLNLPVAAMVHSGGKSLHAIVRVDAEDARQYRERVETLYARCEKNGITVDKANKNPSRLCRMPGVTRGGRRQFLASLGQGAADWDEWEEWYAAETDELPDAEPLDLDLDGERPLQPDALIEGVLRMRDKMLLSGPSKAGKSFALMELCAAFAEGGEWFGWKCRKSRVLYVNLELTASSCRARFYDVFRAMGASNVSDVVPWNLKGHGRALSKLKAALVRRVRKTGADVVIIDPIYKVMMGDESSAKDIGEFTNALDEVIEESGASLIYCHHHSKGFQGLKRAIDRASGSGVFGRDADAIVDMIELDVPDELRLKRAQAKACRVCRDAVEAAGKGEEWSRLGSDVAVVYGGRARDEAARLLDGQTWAETAAAADAIVDRRDAMTAWRIEATLREFERPAPVHVWFDWPLHVIDEALRECPEAGAEQPKPKRRSEGKASRAGGNHRKDDAASESYSEINEAIASAVRYCEEDGVAPTRRNVRDRMPEVNGKQPTITDINNWTRSDKPWCEWVTGEYETDSKRGARKLDRRKKVV